MYEFRVYILFLYIMFIFWIQKRGQFLASELVFGVKTGSTFTTRNLVQFYNGLVARPRNAARASGHKNDANFCHQNCAWIQDLVRFPITRHYLILQCFGGASQKRWACFRQQKKLHKWPRPVRLPSGLRRKDEHG